MLGIVLLATFADGVSPMAQSAALFDELAELYPDTDTCTGWQWEALDADAARGVPVGVHVLVKGVEPGAKVEWRLLRDGDRVKRARAFRLVDVPVEQNTGLGARTEVSGGENRFVIRDAPFRVYEALEPIGATTTADENGTLALRAELTFPADAKPGLRKYRVRLSSGAWDTELQWNVRVHGVTVPPLRPGSPGFTNWFSPDEMASRHGVEVWSEPFWPVFETYADVMARARQSAFWIRWSDFVSLSDDRQPVLDRARFERYVQVFLDRGFTIIEGGHVAGRHGGDWGSGRLDLILTGTDATSEGGRAELAALIGAVQDALDAVDVPEGVTYLQHITDEPTDANAESYKQVADQLRELMPGVRIFEATMSTSLVGAVDEWCPQVQEYQRRRDFFDGRKAEGDRVWVYTCLAPGGPWINRLLDQERLRPVYVGWSLVKYDLAGFLHWGLNHYGHGAEGHDPFEMSVVPHPAEPGGTNFLPAGDTHVVFPGADGACSGQRFEAHRIGMEDAELLMMLKERDPHQAGAIIAKVFRAYDDYETDVAVYRAAKKELLEALSGGGG